MDERSTVHFNDIPDALTRSMFEASGREEGDKAIKSVYSVLRAEVGANAIIIRAGQRSTLRKTAAVA
jgi:hypothetical protein